MSKLPFVILLGLLLQFAISDKVAAQTEIPKSIKLGTFTPTPLSVGPTDTPTPTSFVPTSSSLTSTPALTVPDAGPPVSGLQYCIDEDPGTVLIEACDDDTRCDIAHGAGGPSARCGSAIGWEHVIIESLLTDTGSQYNRRLTDDFTTEIVSQCYRALPWQPYISTFNVIDAYNLAGFNQFSRGDHISVAALESAWSSTAGYTMSANLRDVAPGDVVFFSNPAHVGLVNTVEVDSRGDGDIWFLHTDAAYYLGKLMVAGWNVVSSSTGDISVKFGSHQSKGLDLTQGSTVCYCGSGECYRWDF